MEELADQADLGVVTIQRLEGGTTEQRSSTNTLLLAVFQNASPELPDYPITLENGELPSAWLDRWIHAERWNSSDPWSERHAPLTLNSSRRTPTNFHPAFK